MHIRRTVLSAAAVTIVAAGALTAPVAAQAAPSSIVKEKARGSHCVLSLTPGSANAQSSAQNYRCFTTFAKAMTFASDGTVNLRESETPATSDAEIRQGAPMAAAASSPLLAIEYNSTNYGGTSLTLTGSGGSGCYNGVEYSFGSLGSYGWNDKIESAKTYSNCVGVHYKDSGLSGTSSSVYGSKSDFGSLRNEISSVRFY